MSIDDLFRQIGEDELADGVEAAKENPNLVALTPIQYGRARGIAPQRVYAAYRNGKLERRICNCGRTIVDVEAADVYFGFSVRPNVNNGEEEENDASAEAV